MKSPSLRRVATALEVYQPAPHHIVKTEEEADLVVLHVIGRCEQVLEHARQLKSAGKRYAVIQYCLRSTQRPDTKDWLELWRYAKVVWSYYDLPALCYQDGNKAAFNFYYAPLGANPAQFYDRLQMNGSRPYLAMTHGQSWLTEGVREVVWATRHLGKKALHLGQTLHRGMDVDCLVNIDDTQLSHAYSQTQYICPLRRIEGFELPAAEGVLCGARPVLFDKPHYRAWYKNLAEYIPEGNREQTVRELVEVFSRPYRKVTNLEILDARQRFSWPPIINHFWERALES